MMTEAERMTIIFGEAMALAAERCAATLEATQSKVSGADALRSFANAIRETNAAVERKDASFH
jgi:hypothetical protein